MWTVTCLACGCAGGRRDRFLKCGSVVYTHLPDFHDCLYHLLVFPWTQKTEAGKASHQFFEDTTQPFRFWRSVAQRFATCQSPCPVSKDGGDTDLGRRKLILAGMTYHSAAEWNIDILWWNPEYESVPGVKKKWNENNHAHMKWETHLRYKQDPGSKWHIHFDHCRSTVVEDSTDDGLTYTYRFHGGVAASLIMQTARYSPYISALL